VVAAIHGGVNVVKKASEYREHVEECRTLAAQMRGSSASIFSTWRGPGTSSRRRGLILIRRHPELGLSGEYREEVHLAEEK
jgi:hypothetical protein